MSPWIASSIGLFYIASCLGCVYAGYEYRDARCQAADNKALAEGTQHALGEVEQQGTITREETNAFSKELTNIRNLYGITGVQPEPANDRVPAVPQPAAGTCAHNSATKVYHLTPQQCDQEEAKCNELWNWANRQAQVK